MLKLRKTRRADDHTPTIESFVQLAKGQNIDALYKTFGDVPVQANGEMALKHYLATEVVPFFADADRLERPLARGRRHLRRRQHRPDRLCLRRHEGGTGQAVHARLARRAQAARG